MFRRVETGYCLALFLEAWDAPPGRFYVSYRARHGFRFLMGNGVVDEFRTTSAPLFIAPAVLLGSIYDGGMALADRRDIEAPLDLGWPPLCMGLDLPARPLAPDWQAAFLDVLTGVTEGQPVAWPVITSEVTSGDYVLEMLRCGGPESSDRITVVGTTAPLLPGQLERLADIDDSGLTVAVSTGNRLTRQSNAEPQFVEAVSESVLQSLLDVTYRAFQSSK